MTKGFTSLLLFVLLIMTPSISLASEIEQPLNSLRLTNTLSDLVGGLADSLSLSVQEENPLQDASRSSSESSEAVKMAANVNKMNRAAEEISSMEIVSNQTESANERTQSAEVKSSQLLGIELNLPVVGKVNLGLNTNTSVKSDSSSKQSTSSGGLLELEIADSALLGDVKVGVLTNETQADNNKAVSLVNIKADTPLVDLHLNLGNSGEKVEKTPIEAPAEAVVEAIQPADSYQPDNQSVNQPIEQPAEQPIEQPSLPAKVKPEKQGGHNDRAESVEQLLPTVVNHDNNHEPEASVDMMQPSVIGDDTTVGNFAKADFFGENGAADSVPTAQDQEFAEDMENMKIIIQKLNDNNKLQIVSPSGSANSTGSSSGSTGASSANSSSFGIAAYLSSDCLSEVELCSQVSNRLVELSDQWSKSPPIDPPKVSFFLYA